MSNSNESSLPFGFPLEGIPLAGNLADTIKNPAAPAVSENIKHNPLPVAGYTPIEDDKVQLVNAIKIQEERVLRALDELKLGGQKYDQRFVALALTYVQVGMMLAYRSIFQPKRIKLPEDDE